MRRPSRRAAAMAVAALAGAISVPLVTRTTTSSAAPTFHFALIGDLPYTTADTAAMPALVADINNDPDVQFVAHAGDIKNGSTTCADAELQMRFNLFQGFDDAFWFTPGDNEWTDCHRASPSSPPLDRLAALRALFYPVPAQTTGGAPRAVTPQSATPAYSTFVENTMFHEECVSFGAIHMVGSNNGADPWTDETPEETTARQAEVAARTAADVAWVGEVFDAAVARGSDGVFLLMQAAPSSSAPFAATRAEISAQAQDFAKPVIVAHGDGHVYTVTPNYLGRPNVTRWETYGAAGAVDQWIKVAVDCDGATVFSHQTVTTGSTPPTTTMGGSSTSSSTTITSTTSPAPSWFPIGVADAESQAERVTTVP